MAAAKLPEMSSLATLLCLLILLAGSLFENNQYGRSFVQAYEFTIQHNVAAASQQQQQQQLPNAMPAAHVRQSDQRAERRTELSEYDTSKQQGPDESEAQQLRQLHQVVDTVAHLLNEEEQEEQRRRDEPATPNQNNDSPQVAALHAAVGEMLEDAASEQQQQQRQASSGADEQRNSQAQAVPAELMSESAIRRAIEELERVQQQERQRQEQETIGASGNGDISHGSESAQHHSHQLSHEKSDDIKRSDNNNNNNDKVNSNQEGQSGLNNNNNNLNGPSATSGLESLISELDEELLDDQIAAATQDAERLVGGQQTRRSDENEAKSQSATGVGRDKSDASFVLAATNSLPSPVNNVHELAKSSLVVGQLVNSASDSSELGPAITNDFYSFHAESMGSNGLATATASASSAPDATLVNQQSASTANQDNNNNNNNLRVESSGDASQQPQVGSRWDELGSLGTESRDEQHQVVAKTQLAPSGAQNDLDSAAQTRSAQRQEFDARPAQPFDQSQGSSLNLEFSQPAPQQQGARQQVGTLTGNQQQDQLLRAFRPAQLASGQTAGGNQQQFQPSTTLLPFSADNFWRPSAGSDDFSQQYNRAIGQPDSSGLPPLPQARFQSITPPAPFLQRPQQQQHQSQAQQAPQPQHVHFTGHSFLSGDNPFQNNGANHQSRPGAQVFSSTPQPIISVISGSEPIGANSVSWNPPPAIGQAQQQQQSGPFTSTTPRTVVFSTTQNQPQFRPGAVFTTSPGPPPSQQSNQFRPGASIVPPSEQDGELNLLGDQSAPTGPPANLPLQTESPGAREFARPPVSSSSPAPSGQQQQQWVPSAASVLSQAGTTSNSALGQSERDVADSQPRSTTVRSGGLASTTTSFPPLVSPFTPTPNRQQQFFAPPSQLTTTTTEFPSSTIAPSVGDRATPTNSTTGKKDDMVIYYYYYYDDNKNATVVAKNISANAAGHINGASLGSDPTGGLESDGGIEDTPYMDDPIVSPQPPANLQPQPTLITQRPPLSSSTTSFSTSTTSTSTTPAAVFANTFESPARPRQSHSHHEHDNSAPRSARVQSQQATSTRLELATNSNNESNSPLDSDTESDYEQPPGEQRRPPPGQRLNQPDQRNNQRQHSPEPSAPLRHPTTSQRPPLASVSHGPTTTGHQNQFPAASSARLSPQSSRTSQAAQAGPSAGRQQVPPAFSSGPSSSPASVGANRVSQSNASRYGTSTSNQFLDPFGIDPVAGHQEPTVGGGHHSHNSKPANILPAAQANNRRPAHVDSVLAATGALPAGGDQQAAPSAGNRLPTSQHFSPQRQQQQQHQPSVVSQPTRQLQQQQPQAPQSQRQPERQFFPEQAAPQQPPVERVLPPPKPQTVRQPARVLQPASAPGGDFERANDQDSLPRLDLPKVSAGTIANAQSASGGNQRASTVAQSNGRPTSSEGNTGNGFTRAPPTQAAASSPTPIPGLRISGSSLTAHRPTTAAGADSFVGGANVPHQTGSPRTIIGGTSVSHSVSSQSPASIQPQVSTSTPQRQQPAQSVSRATTMISDTTPPVASPTLPSTTTTTATTSTSTTTTTTQAATTTSTTTTTTTPSPTQAQETSQPTAAVATSTESADSLASSTRRKFGNRNNRFQTRLSAVRASSSTSTTSTTPAPSSSGSTSTTTRRPLASTTRKTSKQLFAGRRRLSGINPSTPAAESSDLASAPISTESPPPAAQQPTTSGNLPSSPISASRARFGNNFTARSRSTSAPQTPESSVKPNSLSPSPRMVTTSKPRLPFLKSNQRTPATSEEELASSAGEPSTRQPASSDTQAVAAGSSATVAATSGEPANEQSTTPPVPSASSDAGAQTSVSTSTGTGTTTSAPQLASGGDQQATTTTGGRNKPKRPLFASRQRNTSLFGNRRSNSAPDATNST